MNKIISNNFKSVLLRCGCIAGCSIVEFYKFNSNIHINIFSSYKNRKEHKKIVDFERTFSMSIDMLKHFIHILETTYNDKHGLSELLFDDTESFIINLDVFQIKEYINSEEDCYTLLFYKDINSYLKNKCCFDITLTRPMLKEFYTELKTLLPEVTSDILGHNTKGVNK